MSKILVIGAGISGVSTAYALLKQGYEVTILERHRYAAMETSFANGGQLSASNAEVWNHWTTLFKGAKWMLKHDAPLLLNPSPTWHKYSWIAEFVSNISNYKSNTVETTRLAISARQYMFEIAEREGIDFDHVTRGILHIYWDKHCFDRATKVNSLLTEGGLDRRPVTPQEIASIEPVLPEKFYGGFFTPSDSTGDIHKYTTGLARACQRLGGRIEYDAAVDRIDQAKRFRVVYTVKSSHGETETRVLEPDGIVVCAGSTSRQLASMLGDRVNIYPVKGYSITVHLDDDNAQSAAPWVSLLDDRAKIVTSRLGNDRLRIAGTAEFNGYNRDIRDDRIMPLIEWTRELFPSVNTNQVVPWAGLRPMMPSMMPHVGKGRSPGVFYNTGHGHLGWTLSAATSALLAHVVSENLPATSRSAA
ncbi:D-amino acid dehydrogenase [Sinorhizobium meliloti]|nr:D-amino acid dehydrogenase [Sinorhizobium meliloti]MDW9739138.1 D-amino acid dehydrogenase [Sinorhizobium meliloti]MDW9893857.1 D-amino acid dehydrogenase [Sinorhizobium meliloti]MDX0079469.1 D-amino acid dehydrogenase [Sinorhizobium meliloti]MDX0097922.1 D-amino acid dehydrogenase [Sinorhizobium meliloti]